MKNSFIFLHNWSSDILRPDDDDELKNTEESWITVKKNNKESYKCMNKKETD